MQEKAFLIYWFRLFRNETLSGAAWGRFAAAWTGRIENMRTLDIIEIWKLVATNQSWSRERGGKLETDDQSEQCHWGDGDHY